MVLVPRVRGSRHAGRYPGNHDAESLGRCLALVGPPRLVAATVVVPNTVVAAFCPVAVDDPSIPCAVRGDFADRQSVGGGCYPGGRPSIQPCTGREVTGGPGLSGSLLLSHKLSGIMYGPAGLLIAMSRNGELSGGARSSSPGRPAGAGHAPPLGWVTFPVWPPLGRDLRELAKCFREVRQHFRRLEYGRGVGVCFRYVAAPQVLGTSQVSLVWASGKRSSPLRHRLHVGVAGRGQAAQVST